MSRSKLRRKQVSNLVDALGGTCQLARLVGVVPSAVSNWKREGRFPARLYVQMRRKLRARGVTVDNHLWGMNGN
jgi:DNA-binding transcriptional regulator YdaS (Cro superfamily)